MEISIVKLKLVLDSLIEWVRQDLVENELTPENSWLWENFHQTTIDDTNFYEQLSSLIVLGDEDKRKLATRLMFDRDRAPLPTFHVHYPSEEGKSGDNAIGTGYTTLPTEGLDSYNTFSRSYVGQYEIIVTGGNSLEVVMLYEFMGGLLMAAADTLAYHFDKFEFSGKQLMPNQDMIPYLVYYRSIVIGLQHKKIVTSIIKTKRAHDIAFHGEFYVDKMPPEEKGISVTITASAETILVAETVVFTAIPVRGGEAIYNWYVNGDVYPDQNSDTLSLQGVWAGSCVVKCIMQSSLHYLVPNIVESNSITILVT